MHRNTPTLLIFAGANGSGKTTAAEYLLPEKGVLEFVNADEIARGLSPLNPAGQRVKAGKLVIARIKELVSRGEDFAVETTLSGHGLAALLKSARRKGYRVHLYYLYTSDVRLNLKRIKYRVAQGGHDVPAKDVRRRYGRSLYNLFHIYMDLCDMINVYDSSEAAKPVLMAMGSKASGMTVAPAHATTWERMKKAGLSDE
jgi:predicted ABC-type ATPase